MLSPVWATYHGTTWLRMAVLLIAATACHRKPTSTSMGQPSDLVVAHVGASVITATELKDQLAQQPPFLQTRYQDPAHKKEFLEGLIKTKVLAEEARRQGVDKQPGVAAGIDKLLSQEMIKRAFDEKKSGFASADIEAFYDAHKDEFVKPEKIRVQHIFLAAPAGTKPEEKAARAKARAKATGLLSQLRIAAAKGEATALFADLARQNSTDSASRQVGGDLRYFTEEELSRQYTPEFARAAVALTHPDQLGDVVETPAGFHVVKLVNRQPGTNKSLDDPQVKESIESRLFREQRSKGFDDYVEKLSKELGVTIDEAALATVVPPAAQTLSAGTLLNKKSALSAAPQGTKPH